MLKKLLTINGLIFIILTTCIFSACSGANTDPIDTCSVNTCSSHKAHFTVLADEHLADQHKLDISSALAEWSIKTNGSLDYIVNFVDMTKVPEGLTGDNNTITIYMQDPFHGKIGWTEWDIGSMKARILIKPDLSDIDFHTVVLHELGHAFNLGHYYGKYKSIMHPSIGNTDQLECTDIRAFCKEWGCQSDCVLEIIEGYDPNMDLENVCVNLKPQEHVIIIQPLIINISPTDSLNVCKESI